MTPATPATPDMMLTFRPGPVVGPVLRRVVGILAARADLPVDRVDEVIGLADALAQAAARHVADERLGVALYDGEGSLRLKFGPLEPGTTAAVLSAPRSDDEHGDRAEVRGGEGGEYLILTVGDVPAA